VNRGYVEIEESSESLATSLRQAVKIRTYLSLVDPWGGVDSWQRPRASLAGCVVGHRRKAMREFSGVGNSGMVKGAAPTILAILAGSAKPEKLESPVISENPKRAED
jgi:hypothetical protein